MTHDNTKTSEHASHKTPIVSITHGDTNSISYEIIIKALTDSRIFDFFTPVVYGNSKLASYYRKTTSIANFNFNLVKSIDVANPKRANIVNINEDEIKVDLGKSTSISGAMALASLEHAINDIKSGKSEILVTAPVCKHAIQSVQSNFMGHTEYLEDAFNSKDVLMIMVGSLMKIAIATTHIPLTQVSQAITKELLINKIYLYYQSLIQDFNIDKPKIAVLGLNPHAGDSGMFGNEETEVILPAIKALQDDGKLVFGPFPADGFFGNLMFKKFDGVFAMYHDQALIPFKTLCHDDGVNYTAGLPIVRTSPAHGTAFDIAGQDIASCEMFKSAILLACEIYKNRISYSTNRSNKLQLNVKNLS